MRPLIYILIFLSGFSFDSLAQTYSLDTILIAWGERATITGRIGASVGDEFPEFAAWTDSIGSLEILEVIGPDTVKPLDSDPAEWDYVLEKKWIVTGWDSGYVDIDSTLHIGVTPFRSEQLLGHVDIIDVNWTVAEQIRRAVQYLPYLIGALLLAGIVWLIVRNIKRKEPKLVAKEEIIRPAHEVALEALEHLKSRESWNKGDEKTFQVKLSAIIREYIDRRFEVSSLDKTSQEATAIIRMLPVSEADKQGIINALLTGDQIKFAKFKAASDVHTKSLQACIDFVTNTKEDEVA